MNRESDFFQAFKGSFTSALRWQQLDRLWLAVKQQQEASWYIYDLDKPPPEIVAERQQLLIFIDKIDQLLRREHKESYCGIVYADNLSEPAFIKIYNPKNLGVSCGYSDNPPLPGWILSKLQPHNIVSANGCPKYKKSWWKAIFDNV